jgi:rSAM/selenodomain-associated transferase 2
MLHRLSIIVPVLNEAALLPDMLARLQPLRERGHEVIVVDGGSADGSPAVAQPMTDVLVRTGAGRARQMNAGARAASGDIYWFLHADSRIAKHADHLILAALEDAPYGAWGRFDVSLTGRGWPMRVIETGMNLRSRLTGIATGDQGIFIRRESFEMLHGFADIELMEDIDISRRLKRLSRPVCLATRLLTSSRRWERDGVLSTVLLMWHLRLAYFLGCSPARLAARYRAFAP